MVKEFKLRLVDNKNPETSYNPYQDTEFLEASFRLLWRHAPDWTQWAAQDADNTWHWFEHQPIPNHDTGRWEPPSHYTWSRHKKITLGNYNLADDLDWHHHVIQIEDKMPNPGGNDNIIDLFPDIDN